MRVRDGESGRYARAAHVALDTDQLLKCCWCNQVIWPYEPKAVYGVGASQYLKAYHGHCEQAMLLGEEILAGTRDL